MSFTFGKKSELYFVLSDQFTSSDDKDEAESKAVVQALEHIDDDCDRLV